MRHKTIESYLSQVTDPSDLRPIAITKYNGDISIAIRTMVATRPAANQKERNVAAKLLLHHLRKITHRPIYLNLRHLDRKIDPVWCPIRA